jgi:hypothetical protein
MQTMAGPESFINVPKDYARLCQCHVPRPLHDAAIKFPKWEFIVDND